jgi:hypothetical protein
MIRKPTLDLSDSASKFLVMEYRSPKPNECPDRVVTDCYHL